ncbi:hypothetical protein ACN47E_003498 [Coniothyrium glycines]
MHLLHLLWSGLLTSVLGHAISKPSKIRTVVTTDMEQDDLASLVRYILYTNELDNQGFIYTSSRYHWEGDGKGTKFFLPGREYNTPQTSWRPTTTTTIEKYVLKAYAEVYPNLRQHDPAYPPPEQLLSITKVGNVDFEGEMSKDTEGSNLIKQLLLDSDPRVLYLQAWGGTNTIARALKSIEEQHSNSAHWSKVKATISRKAVILSSGFQDDTYVDYIAPNWPSLRVQEFSAGYATWGYNCNSGLGNTRGLPDNNLYFSGAWTANNIQIGPLGSLYRSWLDGQTTPGGGDQLDVFGDPARANTSFCQPLEQYAFLSEGDNVVFNPLLTTGLQDPSNPTVGGWGGRARQNSTSPNLWVLVDRERGANQSLVEHYTTDRWAAAVQNDFAARMQWTLTPEYGHGNHAPSIRIAGKSTVEVSAGDTVKFSAHVSDPDDNTIVLTWYQYLEEGTYPGSVTVSTQANDGASVIIPEDAKSGQTISIIAQATDDGEFPLTRYDRVVIHVI